MQTSIPHARGDEPAMSRGYEIIYVVYPTHVGMNRSGSRCARGRPCIPHARGDEPRPQALLDVITTYTPRTWGRGKGYITQEKGEPDFEKLAGAAKAEGQYQLFVY